MKFNPYCDLLIGNRPENDSDTQYDECEGCHRYDTCEAYYYGENNTQGGNENELDE